MKKQKIIIGRIDKATFPELELTTIDAKIDTGAYTSAIHCKDIEEVGTTLKCCFLDPSHTQYTGKKISFDNYGVASVRSSNGKLQVRYTIKTKIIIFNTTYPITLTLAARDDMRFPLLIGRKFLNGKFLIDPQLEYQSYNLIS